MKKFFIFLSLLLLIGCSLYKKVPVYQKSYTFEERVLAIEDAYWWVDAYNGDSVALNDWIVFQKYIDDGYMIEKVYQKKWDDKTEIIISLTTCICDSTTYHLSVIRRSKNRGLW